MEKSTRTLEGDQAAKIKRCILLLLALDAGEMVLTRREWGEYFGCTPRTIARDVAFLREHFGAQIEYYDEAGGYVMLNSLSEILL